MNLDLVGDCRFTRLDHQRLIGRKLPGTAKPKVGVGRNKRLHVGVPRGRITALLIRT